MTELDREIAAYETMRSALENGHMGEWVLVFAGELVDVFPSFDEAARIAVERFGRGPYLIRQIGSTPIAMPASVVYNLRHGIKVQSTVARLGSERSYIDSGSWRSQRIMCGYGAVDDSAACLRSSVSPIHCSRGTPAFPSR